MSQQNDDWTKDISMFTKRWGVEARVDRCNLDVDENNINWPGWLTNDDPLTRIVGQINYILKENDDSRDCIDDKLLAKWHKEINNRYYVDLQQLRDVVTTIRLKRLQRRRACLAKMT